MRLVLLFFCIVVAGVIAEIYREMHGFVISRCRIRSTKLSPDMPELKAVFLSDLHSKEYGANNQELVEAIRKEQPDLILIGGDMLVGKPDISFEKAAVFVEQLPQIATVWYASGNHEQRMRRDPETYGEAFAQYKNRLQKAGVHFLIDENVRITHHGEGICLGGLEVPEECYGRTSRYELEKEEVTRRIGKAPKDTFQILMAHPPEYVDIYRAWGADVILSGHLHGGIVRIPFLGAIFTPQFRLFPKYSGGFYREGDTTIVVSKGLGTHTINIRLFNPAELVVLQIEGQKKEKQEGR
ncbi:metallophosphoesterase [Roseburia hominis]